MISEIIWSAFAERQLDSIYEYYEYKAGIRVAENLLNGIITSADILLKSPKMGQVEPLLSHRDIEYRYLVYKNYKLIYFIDEISQLIKITDVFDTRQNPVKIELSL